MAGSTDLRKRLLAEVMRIRAVDVHSHVPAAQPHARTLRDLLGYHYYTELAHSAGMPRDALAPERPDGQVIPEMVRALAAIDNTVQYGWLIELARQLFGFPDRRLTEANWEGLARSVAAAAERPGRAAEIMEQSNLERVFLTNEVDEDLSAIDGRLFVPSLRVDGLVLKLHEPEVRAALERGSGVAVGDAAGLHRALGAVMDRFRAAGARSVSMSLPPEFRMVESTPEGFERALGAALRGEPGEAARERVLRSGMMRALSGLCRDFGFPFQIMYGVERMAYPAGVPAGTDLPRAGDTLRGLLPLMNEFPGVTYCLSVLTDSQAQELAAYGWIVQNVVLSGHWWYLNVPAYMARNLAGRLQCVPKTKLIGYYSDMYKLEFGLAKFDMYRRVLAGVLAADFVEAGLGTEEDAVRIAHLLLRENPKRIFSL
ncbi:MAG: amidohydrolase [Candidatus Brocadiaceae bacterium]|nr:amidohydrolase [Candidatus Brocadiaceae bacterium]